MPRFFMPSFFMMPFYVALGLSRSEQAVTGS
jgi:hypothetical protein